MSDRIDPVFSVAKCVDVSVKIERQNTSLTERAGKQCRFNAAPEDGYFPAMGLVSHDIFLQPSVHKTEILHSYSTNPPKLH